MKKILFSFFTLIFSAFSLSQEYVPMLNPNSLWEVSNYVSDGEGSYTGHDYKYRLSDQTQIFNENTYQILEIKSRYINEWGQVGEWSNWGLSEIYLCEDVTERKVYIYYVDSRGDLEPGEYLLFDFNLEVGDLIPVTGFINYIGEVITILSIDYQTVYGIENVKTYHVDYDSDDVKI